MSSNKKKVLEPMDDDHEDSDMDSEEDDGPHPDAYDGNEVSFF